MVCKTCKFWASTAAEQLANRRMNAASAPTVKPHECPDCGGTDWMLTDKYVITPPANRSGLMRFKLFRRLRSWFVGILLRRQYSSMEKVWNEEGATPEEVARLRVTIDSFIDTTQAEIRR